MRRYWRIAKTGFTDGWTSPYEFGVGMSYEDGTRASDRRQTVYDRASLLGQAAARRALLLAERVVRSTQQ